jgi:poly-gamma-glutamate synthesis protein (capsule biosynthesis protein)
LAEARAPAYLDVAAGRVALVAANSFFSAPGTQASEQRRDAPGRPGINPAGFKTRYKVDAGTLHVLRNVSLGLGISQDRARHRNLFFSEDEMPKDQDDRLSFLGYDFELGSGFGVTTQANPSDRDGILRAIREARRQADWVIFSIHSHEMGDGGRLSARQMVELTDPATFVTDLAKAAIEAGADVVAGHGPHLTLGIEIYEGRPIFYSLGNFVLQNDTIEIVPAESYGRFGLGNDAGPADFFDTRNGSDNRGFPATREYWESVAALVEFSAGKLVKIELLPIDLGFGCPRAQRGRPVLASGEVARRAIERVSALSRRYGTEVSVNGIVPA